MDYRLLLAAAVLVMTAQAGCSAARPDLPRLEVTADDAVIKESCCIVIPAGTVIEDANGDGVIQVAAPDITIEFAQGSVLRGSPADRRPDEYKGYGIRLSGQANVTIRGAKVSGFWGGLWATKADGLVLDGIDASDNRRAYLRSTPAAEDGADWMFPHQNDENQWLTQYGAAIYVEDSSRVTVCNSRVYHGQNALCLDGVNDSKVYDNDFSFNSGWGVAMWRSSRNVVSRNAVDFCVRGYSHKVYNRGQDSAGILVFEQNNENVIAENSVTHGGDGFFGFAGREALGEAGEHPVEWYKRRGNTDNLLIGNDFSYAPAHGIEMTFSFGNRFLNNRLVGNAICGVWGGYSQDTLIAGNVFEANGEMGYGLERGGVNIEHGRGNRVVHNRFEGNKCGVHYWGGPNPDFMKRGWAKANGIESTDNLIAANTFKGDVLAFHFRGSGDVTIGPNTLTDVGRDLVAEPDYKVTRDDTVKVDAPPTPEYPVFGKTRPVGARPSLRGRQHIIMTEWGPWDHASPLVRLREATGRAVVYDLHEMPRGLKVTVEGAGLAGRLVDAAEKDAPPQYAIEAAGPGVHPYVMHVSADGFRQDVAGTLVAATWNVTFFKWTPDVDPRENLEAYHRLAKGPTAVSAEVGRIALRYGYGGPSDQGVSEKVTAAKLGGDHFGMIATTKIPLTAGKWEFVTLSDDGVRVTVDGKPVIDNWAWHGPTRNTGTLTLDAAKTVEIVVEHFEIDGYATLDFDFSRVE